MATAPRLRLKPVVSDEERTEIEQHTSANLRYWLSALLILESELLELGFRPVGTDSDSHPDPMVEQFLGAHTLVLALRHIAIRLQKLMGRKALPQEANAAAIDFLAEYDLACIADLRDALEHSDEYAAGQGKHPERIVVLRQGWHPGVHWSSTLDEQTGSYRDRVAAVRLFGRDYPVATVLDCARAVGDSL